MNKHDYKQNAYYLMYLIRCVLNDKIPAKEKLDKMDLSGVFAVAKAHSLTAIAAYALESAGIYDNAFEEEKNKAIRKEIILDSERERVLAELENAGIWYMPLKGIIIKELYPQIGMRQMADNDILFDKTRASDIRSIMIHSGFKTELYDAGNQDVYYKPPICNFEMHTELFPKSIENLFCEYYYGIKERLVKDMSKDYCYWFNTDDLYLFIVAHNYKHYSISGTGLRSLVDTYVFLKKHGDNLNMQYIQNECQKLGIATYEKQNRQLALNLLNGCKLTADEKCMFDYTVFSGTYGTVQNTVNNKLKKDRMRNLAKLKLIRNRVFVPFTRKNPRYKVYAARYKWFYKSKARIPLLFFYRIGTALTCRRNRAKMEFEAVLKAG